MHMTTMSPRQLAALQQSLDRHPTATPGNSSAAHTVQDGSPGVGTTWLAAAGNQHLHPNLRGQQQQEGTTVTADKNPAAQQVSDVRMHDQSGPHVPGPPMQGGFQGSHPTVVHGQMASQQQPVPVVAAGQTARHSATSGTSQQLPVLQGRPVDTPADAATAAAALAAEAPILADRIPVADASTFAQQQTQLFYAMVAEERGNVRHDLRALTGAAGLWGDAADAAVQAGLRNTAAGTARAAQEMLAELNESETGQLLSSILSDPLELDWQTLLLESVQCNRESVAC